MSETNIMLRFQNDPDHLYVLKYIWYYENYYIYCKSMIKSHV
jgi:hypothetical protein